MRILGFLSLCLILLRPAAGAQSSVTGGTIEGTVLDPSGAAVAGANVAIINRLTGFERHAVTDAAGAFRFSNVPPNPYHVDVTAPGFDMADEHVTVRSAVPATVNIRLSIAGGQTSVTVESAGADLLENVPYAHNDVDAGTYSKLPAVSPGSGLSDAVTLSSPGVVADSNGFFHPLGDHAQVTFSIDGQPVSDQQSKQFSTQLPLNAVQSMEIISGAPPAEYGDKTSLVVNAITRSGLGQSKPTGSIALQYGSFGTLSEEGTFSFGGPKYGNFLTANADRSGRFLDTPEFHPMHAVGNNQTVFDRFDLQPAPNQAIHVNALFARNWFQVPNTYDQPNQDQRQKVTTVNFAPGYQRTFGAGALLTINTFFRQDHVNYYPSRDPFADLPATVSQSRGLTNWGARVDGAFVRGKHNVKVGTQVMQTRLREQFQLGVTDPAFNPVCLAEGGAPVDAPGITGPALCAPAGFLPNPGLQPGLVPFDLTRGGQPFQFFGRDNINQAAVYAQDSITWNGLNVTAGLRFDHYSGLTEADSVQPRAGISYLIKPTGTVVRAAYSRTFETPYNENLIVSSSTGAGGLAQNVFGAFESVPIQPGRRNQYNAGIQQNFDRLLQVDLDYFWKYTQNAFDFGTLFNTPIQFPISWRKSKIDGLAVRLSTPDLHGFQAIVTMGHTRARFFGPSNGGLVFNSPLNTGVFRIDHDQAFQQTTSLRYQRPKNGAWFAFTWRYDTGLVAGAVPDLESALALTAAQQSAIGFFCGGEHATLGNPITTCASPDYGAERLRIPAPGTADPDHNPPRITSRNLFNVAAGTGNLFRTERYRTTLKFSVLNLANTAALYNFLSTFSGTHFVAPRSYQAELGFAF